MYPSNQSAFLLVLSPVSMLFLQMKIQCGEKLQDLHPDESPINIVSRFYSIFLNLLSRGNSQSNWQGYFTWCREEIKKCEEKIEDMHKRLRRGRFDILQEELNKYKFQLDKRTVDFVEKMKAEMEEDYKEKLREAIGKLPDNKTSF